MRSNTLRAAVSAPALLLAMSLSAPAFAQSGPSDEQQDRDTVIVAAKADPERPAKIIAVINGPSSRSIARPTRFATKMSAPNRRSEMAP